MAAQSDMMHCLRHPERETGLRCGRCGDPICPSCMVQAVVGIRCPACVTWERNPIVQVATSRLLAAVGAGMGTAVVAAIAVAALSDLMGGFFSLVMWAVAGYLIGQAVHIAANRSRARALRYVAGGSAAFAWTFSLLFTGGIIFALPWIVLSLLALGLAIMLAITPFR